MLHIFCGNCYTFVDSWWIEITVFEIESFRNILNVFTVPLEQMNASVDASNVEYLFKKMLLLSSNNFTCLWIVMYHKNKP